MKKIDAHCHLIEVIAGFSGRGELRGVGGGRARWADGEVFTLIPPEFGDRAFTADSLAAAMEKNGVDKAVLLQGSLYGFQNEYSLDEAHKRPDMFVPAVTVDPYSKNARSLLERFLTERKASIVKFEVSAGAGLMSFHTAFALDGPVTADLFAIIHSAGATLTLDIGAYGTESHRPQAVAAVAKRYPDMRIVVCHLLLPNTGPESEKTFREEIKMLKLPNVWFDLAALPYFFAHENYPYPSALKFIAAAREITGAKKLIWGSDIPYALVNCSYGQSMRYIEESGLFTDTELEDVFRHNAEDAYSLR